MKQIKNIILILIFFINILNSLSAQINAGVTTICSYSACSGTIITVPLSISGSPDIASLSLEIDYDAGVLSFLKIGGITNINSNLLTYDSLVGIQSDISPSSRRLRIGWYSNDGNAYSVGTSGNGTLCELSFVYYGGYTSLDFNNNVAWGNMCEYNTIDNNNPVTCIDEPTGNYFINGSINPNSESTPANSATGTSPISDGSPTTLSITGGSLGTSAIWHWYSGSCGGTYETFGASPIIYPSETITYYVRAEGTCNTTSCVNTTITVKYIVEGNYTYNNFSNGSKQAKDTDTPLDSVEVFLMQNGNTIDSTQADINGYYKFPLVDNGPYNIKATTHKPSGGVNGTDALTVQRSYLGLQPFSSSLALHAADVNFSDDINGTDALLIQRYFLGITQIFARGAWIFEKPDTISDNIVPPYYNDTIIVSGSNILQDVKGICAGDVNGSYVPDPGKSVPKITFNYNSVKKLNSDEYFEIPVKITDNVTIGAISLLINFPEDLVEILGVKLSNNKYNQLYYNVISNNLRIVWVQNNFSLILNKDETLLIIKVKTKVNFKSGNIIRLKVDNNSLCELADPFGKTIDNAVLNIPEIKFLNDENIQNTEDNAFDFDIYPNPAVNFITINYNIINDEFVNVSLYNSLGEMINNIENKFETKGNHNSELNISGLQSGIYSLKMILNNNRIVIRKLIIFK